MTDIKPYLTIPLLEACNFRCVYCPPEGETYHTPKTVFLPEKICGVLDTVMAVGMTKVRFSGGEPLMYPHLEQVIDYAVNLGLEVHMNTNGYFLLQQLPWLQHYKDKITVKVSLDAHSNEALQAVSKVSKIERVIEGIRQGAAAGIVKRLNFVLTRLNADQIPGILALCKELGLGLKIFDMYPVPETEQAWRIYFAPMEVLALEGEAAPIDPYTQKYGTPTEELLVDGVPVRIKNCFNGTRYHAMCEQCAAFPCPEGLYCVQVTPSMTVVPCRLGLHLYRQCDDFTQLGSALSEIIDIYDTSYLAHDFGNKYQGFHDARLIELEGGAVADLEVIPLLGYVANTSGENIRC